MFEFKKKKLDFFFFFKGSNKQGAESALVLNRVKYI